MKAALGDFKLKFRQLCLGKGIGYNTNGIKHSSAPLWSCVTPLELAILPKASQQPTIPARFKVTKFRQQVKSCLTQRARVLADARS